MKMMRLLSATAWCTVAVLLSAVRVMAADVDYAPPEADLIFRINGAKLCRSRAWAAIRSSDEFGKCAADVRHVLAKSGVTVDDVFDNTDLCIFADTRAACDIDALAGNPKIAADTALNWLDSERGGLAEKTRIDGRPARVVREDGLAVTAIALDKHLIQFSVHDAPAKALVRRPRGGLAGAVDLNSALCLVYKCTPVSYEVLGRQLPQVAPFLNGLEVAVVRLNDDDGIVRLDAELRVADLERAQNIEGQLNMLLMLGMMSWQKREPEKAEIVRKFRITRRETRIFVNFACPYEELCGAFLN